MLLPELVAHRGYARHYPENTLIAIEAAIQAGARYIEVDVQLAADQVPFLFHDDTLDRMCGVSGAILEYDSLALRHMRALEFDSFGYRYAQNPLATLEELAALLARHRTVTAFVEIKSNSIEHFGITTVLDRILPLLQPVASQCVLISFADKILAAARQRHWPRIGGVIERWHERKRSSLHSLAPEFLFCDVEGLPRWGKLRALDAQLVIYEIDDAERALRLAARGVAFVETFAIGEMRARFEEMSRTE